MKQLYSETPRRAELHRSDPSGQKEGRMTCSPCSPPVFKPLFLKKLIILYFIILLNKLKFSAPSPHSTDYVSGSSGDDTSIMTSAGGFLRLFCFPRSVPSRENAVSKHTGIDFPQ